MTLMRFEMRLLSSGKREAESSSYIEEDEAP